ncbi:MAG TPA: TIGR03435 family protein [Bryobacteraceae bacterium]|jgi:uncharacterized protein (TIGR03435 family)
MKRLMCSSVARTFPIAPVLLFLLEPLSSVYSQVQTDAPAKRPLAFEVASVKPGDPNAIGGQIRPLPGGETYISHNLPVLPIILLLYHLCDAQLDGVPGWLRTDRWEIMAKAPRPSNADDLHEMFKTLLADRFQFRFHTENRELPRLALRLDASGVRMKRNESPNRFDIPIDWRAGKAIGQRVSMNYFSLFLSQQLNRPVVDLTGLNGFYDFTLEWSPDLPAGADNLDADAPSLFTALRQQLGLKLDSERGLVPVMVIDHIEKPSQD